jgi:hypothetical protein
MISGDNLEKVKTDSRFGREQEQRDCSRAVCDGGLSQLIKCMRKQDSGSSEEPDQSGGALRIEISPHQFAWLTKQCQFLGISKQQLVADAVEEWVCRNRTSELLRDPSATAQMALDEFMLKHRDEFLPTDDL